MLGTEDRLPDPESHVRPEEVLLQIALGFTVVLGFLLSNEVTQQTAIEQRLERAEAVYEDLVGSSRDELIREVDAAVAREERMNLINAWLRVRGERLLFRRVALFEEPNGPIERLTASELLADRMFTELRDEVARVYRPEAGPAGARDVLAEEITECAVRSLEVAGYRPPSLGQMPTEWLRDIRTRQALALLVEHARVQRREAHPSNVSHLISEIRTDFQAQRRKAARVQLRLVTKVAEVKLVERTRIGGSIRVRDVLNQVVSEIDQVIRLLPEVRAQLASTE